MRRLLTGGALALMFLASPDASACQNDRDCPAASHCVLVWGRIEGFCKRGVSSVPGQEVVIMGDPDAPKSTEGMPCEFSVDCASGLTCMAETDSSLRFCRR